MVDFLECFDVFFMFIVVIGGFFKISVFFYVIVIGVVSLFKIKFLFKICFFLGFVILFYFLSLVNNYEEFI